MFTSSDEVLSYIKDEGVEFVDVRFMRPARRACSTSTCRPSTFDEDFFTEGQMFDGSSIRGFAGDPQVGHEADPGPGDRLRRPVPHGQDAQHRTSPSSTRAPASRTSRDPRQVAAKAEAYLKSTGIADTVYFGPEAEFYIFDDVRFETKQNAGYYYIDSDRGRLEHRPRRGGRQPRLQDPRTRAATSRSRRTTTTPTCATR